jgi:uncharacterized membrane protein (UPF0127 family)
MPSVEPAAPPTGPVQVYSLHYHFDPEPAVRRIVVARSWFARAKGLLGVRKLTYDDGMVFFGANALHTYGMSMSIDVLWLRAAPAVTLVHKVAAYDVVDAQEFVKPHQGLSRPQADSFVELAAGALRRLGEIPAMVTFR